MKQLIELNRKELKGKCGVYKLTCNTRIYIGSSKNLYSRLREHKYRFNTNTHSNDFMMKACNKYGIESFYYEILEECSQKTRIIREKYFIDLLKPDFNLQLDPVSRILSSYSRQKLSKSIKKGLKEGKYKTKFDYCKVQQFDYLGNLIQVHSNKIQCAKNLNISKKQVSYLAGGYKKGLVWKGIRLRYELSKVPIINFSKQIDSKYIGKHYDFYHNGKKVFSTVKEVWAFLANQVLEGNTEINIQVKLKKRNQ